MPLKFMYLLLLFIPISFFAGVFVTLNLFPVKNELKFSPDKQSHSHSYPKFQLNDNLNSFNLQHRYINQKQISIINAMKHSWYGYKKYAWGSDQLKPASKSSDNWFNIGLSIIDSLDTLILMSLNNEFNDAKDWLENESNFNIDSNVNCFETTIRVLGGLLSAYHLTKIDLFKQKSQNIGERLYHCYPDKKNFIPYSDVNLKTKFAKLPEWSSYLSTSEISSIQLEFRDLSRLTKNPKYEVISYKTSLLLHNLTLNDHLVKMYINPYTNSFVSSTITLGARCDSYYEYLLKQYLQTGIKWFEDDYITTIEEIKEKLVKRTTGKYKLNYIAEINTVSNIYPKMDHLVCFLPGTLALGYYKYNKMNDKNLQKLKIYKKHLNLAEELARTCYFTYNTTQTGLAPEITHFDHSSSSELYIKSGDSHNLLRPEYVESLFYLYHITKKEMYRNQGWKIFNSFVKYCKIETGGFTSINNVNDALNPGIRDLQESFWMSETLKYLFLLFSDDEKIISDILDNYVFNTESHLLPIFNNSD